MTNDQAIALVRKLNIRCVVFDIDGVMTDGNIIVDLNGNELFKTFNVKDGLGVQMLAKAGFELGIITSRCSKSVESRAQLLNISHVYQGQAEKIVAFEDLLATLSITDKQVAYIGDDLPDVPLLRRAGFSACPADAHKSAASVALWQSAFNGGRGAVREFADLLLTAKEKINA